jgi:hypothetical protein
MERLNEGPVAHLALRMHLVHRVLRARERWHRRVSWREDRRVRAARQPVARLRPSSVCIYIYTHNKYMCTHNVYIYD